MAPIFHFLVNRQPHPSPHRPAFSLARDLFRLHIDRFTNRPRPRGARITLANHMRRQCDFTAIRQGKI